MHITGLSTAEGVTLVRAAKKKGLDITADVHVMNLLFNETSMLDFDTQFKALPVLRTETDRLSLIKGVLDGTIDTVSSDHRPLNVEEKEIEFDYAGFGCIQLQTLFPNLNTHFPEVIDQFINALSIKSRVAFGIELRPIEVDSVVDATLFDANTNWVNTREQNSSKSTNSPFLGKNFTGKVHGILRNDSYILAD